MTSNLTLTVHQDSSEPPVNIAHTRLSRAASCLAALLLSAACAGGGGGGSDTSSNAPSGTLTVSNCVISEGAQDCEAVLRWETSNTSAVAVVANGTTVSTQINGTTSLRLGVATVEVRLNSGTQLLAQRTISATCTSASAWNGSRCAAFARRVAERAPTPFVSGGSPVTLEVVVFEPLTPGPWPAVLFHHGSTGNGDDPALFTQTFTSESVARHFTERGWLVAFPQRRGRGASGGVYDEGFTPDRSRYSCFRDAALAGVEHALADAEAALTHLQQRQGVIASRLIVAGQSRGGILAVAQAGLRPGVFVGVINFVGGWLGEGCQDAIPVNTMTFARGGGYPGQMLWLYGENDPFYSANHSRANFSAFQSAGGRGAFTLLQRAAGLSGHLLINDAALWAPAVNQYLDALPGV